MLPCAQEGFAFKDRASLVPRPDTSLKIRRVGDLMHAESVSSRVSCLFMSQTGKRLHDALLTLFTWVPNPFHDYLPYAELCFRVNLVFVDKFSCRCGVEV
ncbi:hypothetical protein AVEN_61760-1 [Araneus ventricosus]|uniref:Uncharacterized protein n=1 Tax=Araneus ventricosus TaxID=182803 RepID=A0A4Y2SZA5_ARAVE|nr:hypothetical protein AVEN_61760-1 [Araneus ventricosus]